MSRWISVGDIVDLLHGGKAMWKAIAMLQAYFDESGTHGGPVVTIAGYVATRDAWVVLEAEWRSALLDRLSGRGVTWFHMTDCANGWGEFEGISYNERQNIITLAAGILSRHDISVIWAGVNSAEFDQLTTPGFRKRYQKPYDLCFDEVVSRLWNWGQKHAPGERISMVLAEQEEYRGRNDAAHLAWRDHPRVGKFIGALAFDFPKYIVPLQAADMVAYELAKEWEAVEYTDLTFKNDFQKRATLELIMRGADGQNGGFYGSQGLTNLVSRFSHRPWYSEMTEHPRPSRDGEQPA